MMTMTPFAYSYLICNFLLVGALLLFSASNLMLGLLKILMSPRYHLRIGQSLFSAAILFGSIVPHFSESISPSFNTKVVPEFLEAIEVNPNLSKTVSEPSFQQIAMEQPLNLDQKFYPGKNELLLSIEILLVIGFLWTLLRLIRNAVALRKILLESTLFRKVGKVSILVSQGTSIPFSTRVFLRAHVVIPLDLIENRKNLNIAIRHEIQHHRQGDTLWVILMELGSVLFFWNPTFFLWKRRLEELQEISCDEMIIGQRKVSEKDYGTCLIDVAENLLNRKTTLVGSIGMASDNPNVSKTLLQRRVNMLFSYQRPIKHFRVAVVIGGICLTNLFVLSTVMGGNSQASPKETLSVDSKIQEIANQALGDQVQKTSATSGFAIVANPKNGNVLAISYYDGTKKIAAEPKVAAELVLRQVYPLNSLIKPIFAAYALDKKKITFNEKLNCENGFYQVAGRTYPDHTHYGLLTPSEVVAVSSDIGSMKIVEKLGKEGMLQAMSDFGFGEGGTATHFPEAATGHYPTEMTEATFPKIYPEFSIGRKVYSSPIELVQAYGVLAGNGSLLKPTESKQSSKPSVLKQTISPETALEVRKMLENKQADSPLYSTAGKTGTANSYAGDKRTYFKEFGAAHFIGFSPVTHPEVLVYVVIQSPEKHAHGSEQAAPVFKTIIEKTLQYLKVSPDKVRS